MTGRNRTPAKIHSPRLVRSKPMRATAKTTMRARAAPPAGPLPELRWEPSAVTPAVAPPPAPSSGA